MNETSPLLLIGIGGAGCSMARGVMRAFGSGVRAIMLDTDATSARENDNFLLLGGDRLSGRGAGGDLISARLATEDSIDIIDEYLSGVRLAIIVTALGGATGGGSTIETVNHLTNRGIPSVVFATTPFEFEGEVRRNLANTIAPLIQEAANASFFLSLDKLVGETDNMDEALRRGIDTLASAVTLFWRLIEKPGYIRLDTERVRHLISKAGRGRFATITLQGPNRSVEAVDALSRSPLLADGNTAIRAILCGILAGEDLRLSEVGKVATNLRKAFGESAAFELATVNDEMTFSGRLSVVVMLFETNEREAGDRTTTSSVIGSTKKRRTKDPLAPSSKSRFSKAERTFWNNEDLDIPTYLRRNINLDF